MHHDLLLRRLIEAPAAPVRSLLRRARVQVEFAREFARSRPEFAEAAREAEGIYLGAPASAAEVEAWVAKIEAALAPIEPAAKAYTVHLVGHGHLDMNWMWSWPETVAATRDTFASALAIMRSDPDFTYSQSQASVYALMERYHPAEFAEIQSRVKEGRWEVAAAHWVEGDKNLASGESLARHLLYTREYFADRFGLTPEDVPVDWEPDTFGHAETIPNILVRGGVKYYYSCRPGGGHEHPRVGGERPPVFWWQGTDGSRVLVNRETTWYNSYVNIGENVAASALPFYEATGLTHWLNVYGVGNHGGGPTRDEITWLRELMAYPVYPTLRFSTSKAYFEAIEREIGQGCEVPTLAHELNYEFTGCYTSQSAIKRANRFGENYGVEAEGLLALGTAVGAPPTDADRTLLREAWINVLFNQFHDILPGSGVAATREHAQALFQETGAITGAIKRRLLDRLAETVDTLALLPDTPEGQEERQLAGAGRSDRRFEGGVGQGAMQTGLSTTSGAGRRFFPVLVYNPLPFPRSEMVEAHLYDADLEPTRIVAQGPDGKKTPTLVTYRSSSMWADWGHLKTSLVFPATDVPAMGYKVFLLTEGVPDADVPQVTLREEHQFETPWGRFQLDRFGSGIKELSRKDREEDLSGWEGSMGAWWTQTEQPRGMTSWVIGGPGTEDRLSARSADVHGANRNQGTDLPGGHSVAYLATRQIPVPGTESSVTLRALVHGLAPRIDFTADVDWREIGTPERGIPGLYVEFPDEGNAETIRFETPFGSIERSDDCGEVPSLRYAHLPGARITVLQDSKYGHVGAGGAVRFRVVRSSFDPDHAPEVGKSTLRYSIYLHDAPPTAAELERLGAAWNSPLIVVGAPLGPGEGGPGEGGPGERSFVELLSPEVALTVVKPAQTGSGLILRFAELDGQTATAQVRLDPALVPEGASVETVDLLERPAPGEARLEGGVLTVKVPPKGVATVRVG